MTRRNACVKASREGIRKDWQHHRISENLTSSKERERSCREVS